MIDSPLIADVQEVPLADFKFVTTVLYCTVLEKFPMGENT
jgi:hypothetical protein